MNNRLIFTLAALALAACRGQDAPPGSENAPAPALSFAHTPYANEQGFRRHAFCAGADARRGQTLALDVKLPQDPAAPDTYQRYDLIVLPAIRARLANPQGEALPLRAFPNRYPQLGAHPDLLSPARYEGHRDGGTMALKRHEGIYRLTALENKRITVCIVGSGFGTRISGETYPDTVLPDGAAAK